MTIGDETVSDSGSWRLYIHWLGEDDLAWARGELARRGLRVRGAKLTPCQTMKATPEVVLIASPGVFNGLCGRQGSWYRRSVRAGQSLLVSGVPLNGRFASHLDAVVSESDFAPADFPSDEEIVALTHCEAYQQNKPADWELIGRKDAILQKLLFTITGVWKRGDNLKKHWPRQCASHANFLARTFTTERDGEAVPYSVSNSVGICSSCVETFNIVAGDTRKLVAPCPGAVRLGGAEPDAFLDVRPARQAGP